MEREFIDWLRDRLRPAPPIRLGIGDDAGVIEPPGHLVVTTDTIADGVHFDTKHHSLAQIGHKVMAVNLSDVAAMGAVPIATTLNFLFPKHFNLNDAKSLFMGIEQLAIRYGVAIFGGDTNRWDGKLVVSATAYGALNESSTLWQMSGAKPGDAILVSGELGGSIIQKHVSFEPRVGLANYLAGNYLINSATDVTDSLAIDLAAIATQSNLGFQLNAQSIPVSADAHRLSRTSGQSPLEHALYDGEDFELVFSTSQKTCEAIVGDKNCPIKVAKIGDFTEESGIRMIDHRSDVIELEIRGYEH